MSDNHLIDIIDDSWTMRLDLRALPRYWILELAGRSSPERNERLRQILREHQAEMTDAMGDFYPLIVNMQGDGNATMEGLQGGIGLVREFAGRMPHIVIVLNPQSGRGRFLQTLLPSLERVGGRRFEVVESVDAAVAHLTTPTAPDHR